MRALVAPEPGVWRIADVRDPEPAPGDVIVAVRSAGICGSDLHLLAGEFPPTPFPIIPGHEFSGVVTEIGDGVSGLRPGDRVAVDPSLFCGSCSACQVGRGNLCAHWGAIGDTVDGAFADLVRVPAGNAYRMPDSMSFADGALVEPLSCVVHGLNRLRIRPGSELLIVGGGTIGLMMLQAAAVSGAAATDLVDLDAGRRDRAEGFGARQVAASVDDLVAARGRGYDYVVEATGVPAAAEAAIDGLAPGGTMLVFGVANEGDVLRLPQYRVYAEELTILGSMAVLNSFAPAMQLMAAGVVSAASMVTDEFVLEDFGGALEAVRARTGLKIQIRLD